MAEWNRETPWRQGCALTDETVEKFGLRDARAPESTLVVVVSHDCDLAASPDKEPEIELIVGRQIEKADGNFTHAKTARVLHIEFATPSGGKFVELSAIKKVRRAKGDFADFEPRGDFLLSPTEQTILQRWLAARYRRAAFPDAFDKRLNQSSASAQLTKILKPAGKHICGIFFDVDSGNQVRRNEPDDCYTLTIVILYTSWPSSRESEAVALQIRDQIESLFEKLFLSEDNSWRDIELLECIVVSDQALTYAHSVQLKQWRLEHLSLREDPEDPMIQE